MSGAERRIAVVHNHHAVFEPGLGSAAEIVLGARRLRRFVHVGLRAGEESREGVGRSEIPGDASVRV